MTTAGMVVIGNEVLSGKVKESNATYLSVELRRLGVDLRWIAVVPDEVPVIAEAVRTASERFDLVFTTGGVGPTHDDVTLEAIAASAGVPIRRHEEFAAVLRKGYGDRINDLLLRMADLPEGATLLWEDDIPVPVISLNNIYIFPGEPGLLRRKFEAVKERFRSAPYHLKRIYTLSDEGEIAELLADVDEKYPDVMIGSYPVYAKTSEYRTQVTVESRDEERTRLVTEVLTDRIPSESILRVE